MKKASPFILLLASATLLSCGANNGGAEQKAAANLEHVFAAEQKLIYSNNRPDYNYYETTFVFQELELYSDKTYKLTESSCTFSALELPETGNGAKGNAKGKSLFSYYGKYSATVNDLDDTGLDIVFETPTRFAGFRLGSIIETNGVIDTDDWTDTMKSEWADVKYEFHTDGTKTELERKEYNTGADWLAAHQYTLSDTFASATNHAMDWVNITLKNA